MLNGLRFMVNWLVKVRSITYVFMSNRSGVPFFNYKSMINRKFSLPIF
ncbi:hypothetical protein P5G62_011310 [Neobacillus sp. 179-C4.2 HS]|uniref:Uncharacterized protein n=1 Tax=Neobacillus driksii TaxID=3035913 RepID=A0ABV4YUB9_9BACI|nr:hypothetical protein [Neobacillus sp. 179.-C4.2 HS]MDP5194187.1 hypothetical protein [Neobacillus sp. 179.-C4.2 HS]